MPSFLSSKPGAVDVLYSTSNNILFNLATEEYIFEHCDVVNPVLFLWRNNPTIIIGKHQNPWKECRVQKLEEDNVLLARRKSGGGCVYQDLGNSVFSFINPVGLDDKVDFKTMNNGVLLAALSKFGIQAEASGRNDLIVKHEEFDKKISGSAYKLRLGNTKTGEGRRALHHGTMLLDLELTALGQYLNPSKAKLQSKGVDSVISRVINLKQLAPTIDHDNFCASLEHEFIRKYEGGGGINKRTLPAADLEKIPKIKEIFDESSDWQWRFGETPNFSNSLETKFPWALVDFQFNVEKGMIVEGRCFSDCLVPPYIDAINEILGTGQISYDVNGIKTLCNRLKAEFNDEGEQDTMLRESYTPELEAWLCEQI